MYAVKKAIGIYNEAIKEVTTIADPMPQVQGLFVFPNCTPTSVLAQLTILQGNLRLTPAEPRKLSPLGPIRWRIS